MSMTNYTDQRSEDRDNDSDSVTIPQPAD